MNQLLRLPLLKYTHRHTHTHTHTHTHAHTDIYIYIYIQIFFSYILVSLKKGLRREWNGRFGMNVNFSYQVGPQDEEGAFIG